MRKGSTKERILECALNLFSERGYDGVGVDEIAREAGIKGPSLYRHFKGKKEILKAIVQKVEKHYSDNFEKSVAFVKTPDSLSGFEKMTMEQIEFSISDSTLRKARKFLSKEQFRSDRLAALTTRHFRTEIEETYAAVFEKMMDAGLLKRSDPGILAMEYVSPVTVLIHMCDREPERIPEAMALIRQHIAHFINTYGVNGNG